MRKTPLLVVGTLTVGLAVGMLLGRPALAKISGGNVSGSWRCEHFSGPDEGEMAQWLSTYAPAGPAQALLAAGGQSSGFWMVCAHGSQAVKGGK